MKTLAIRLVENDDLKIKIKELVQYYNIQAGVILSSVGCLKKVKFRNAKAQTYFESNNDYEIISLNGTIGNEMMHLHIGISDENGNCFGGHLEEGCIINTTCELVVGVFDEYEFDRQFDTNTGYKELVIKRFDIK